MRKIGILSGLGLVLLGMTSCIHVNDGRVGRGEIITEERSVGNFEKIRVLSSCDVLYTQGDTVSVTVEGEKQDVERTEVIQQGNTLVITHKNNKLMSGFNNHEVNVYVTSPDLIGVSMRGSGDFKAAGHIDTDTLDIELTGSGDMDFEDIVCDELRTTLKGSGDVEVKRVQCNYSSVFLMGSGDVEVNHERVAKANLSLKGSGDIKAGFANGGDVNAEILGSGDIIIKGNPGNIRKRVRGSGDVTIR